MEIRKDITVIMVAPKCPGSEVRQEYLRGFGVPTLIAVHDQNDHRSKGLEYAKAYAVATWWTQSRRTRIFFHCRGKIRFDG